MTELLTVKNVPREALGVLKQQLEQFGAAVRFEATDESVGVIDSPSGKLGFRYGNGELSVSLIECRGHFAKALLVGGVRQMVEEAIELTNRKKGAA